MKIYNCWNLGVRNKGEAVKYCRKFYILSEEKEKVTETLESYIFVLELSMN